MRTLAHFAIAPGADLAALFLTVAMLPSLLFLGHWGSITQPGHHHHAGTAADPLTQGQHETHCHAGLASCSEQPPPSTFSIFADAIRPEAALGAHHVLPAASQPIPESHSTAPPTPPPNGAV